jgi:hypothetical protein
MQSSRSVWKSINQGSFFEAVVDGRIADAVSSTVKDDFDYTKDHL